MEYREKRKKVFLVRAKDYGSTRPLLSLWKDPLANQVGRREEKKTPESSLFPETERFFALARDLLLTFFCLPLGKKGGGGKELKAKRPDGKTNVVGSFNNNSRA